MNTGELVESGVSFPPYHPRCYCQLVAYIEDRYEPVEVIYGEEAKRDEYLNDFVKSYKKEELVVKVNNIKSRATAKNLVWARSAEIDHRKWKRFGYRDINDYQNLVLRSIENAEKVAIKVHQKEDNKPQVQMRFYYKVNDRIGSIVGVSLEGNGAISFCWVDTDPRKFEKKIKSARTKEVWLKRG